MLNFSSISLTKARVRSVEAYHNVKRRASNSKGSFLAQDTLIYQVYSERCNPAKIGRFGKTIKDSELTVSPRLVR